MNLIFIFIKRYVLIVAAVLGLFMPLIAAQAPNPNSALKLIPQPKELQIREGSFRLKASTKILVEFGHQDEDRIAAETLAEEIRDQSGLTIEITGSKEKGKQQRSSIELARLQDKSVLKFLQTQGLKADGIGDQGYLLYADRFRLIVAANTGQGLFYGVQTLRQLIHLDGKELVCPAVAIRDWPSTDWHGVQDDMSRSTIPNEDSIKAQNNMKP